MEIEKMIEDYPKTIDIISRWFFEMMINSFENENIPEEMKDYEKNKEIVGKQLGIIIKDNPRSLFDIFDSHKIYINFKITTNPLTFIPMVNGVKTSYTYDTRKGAEREAVEKAFELLESKL